VAADRKKQRLIALSFCDFISQDSIGKVNLMGCFDSIYRDKETKQTGIFYLYVRTAETRKGKVDVTFLDPKNVPIAQVTYEVNTESIPLGKPAHAQIFTRSGFVADELGVYWVDVAYNGESLGGRDLTVSEREAKEGNNEHGTR
jgi:hypothetical protein